jgi:hypothetical protein
MSTKNYPTSQAALYIILRLMWQSCLTNILTFAGFKAKYKATFIAARLAEIDAAEALPSEEQRSFVHKQKRDDLSAAGKEGRRNWQSLKLYINSGFENPENYYESAGMKSYEEASNENWPALNELLRMGSEFIAANLAALKANENMPDTFQAAFDSKKDEVKTLADGFYAAEENARIATDLKTVNNNQCYTNAIAMGADGQHLFQDNDEMRKLFSFDAVKELVSPSGASEVTVTVYVETNGVKVAKKGAEVSIVGTDKSGITDDDGKVTLTQLPDGAAKIKVTADGFNDNIIDTEFTGTMKRIEATLTPLFQGEMTVGSVAGNGVAV